MNKVKVTQDSRFDLNRARELLNLVAHAHAQFDRAINEPSWNWENDLTAITVNKIEYEILCNFGFTEFFAFRRQRVPFGFIAKRIIEENKTEIFVVFRGTMTPAEWIDNFQAFQQPFLVDSNLGDISRGFHKIYTRPDQGRLSDPRDDRPPMKQQVEATLSTSTDCPQCSQVFVTGHSLGGALATIAALHIHKLTSFKCPILYTFASPRVGDPRFAKNFDIPEWQCYRVANTEDIVQMIPAPTKLLVNPNRDGYTEESLREVAFLFRSRISESNFQHVGEPICFTTHKGSISDNHIIPTYQEALAEQHTPVVMPQPVAN